MSCHHEFATLFSHRRVRWRQWNEMLRELLPILVWAVCDVLGRLWRAQGLPFVPRVFIISDTYRNMGLGAEKVLEVKIIFWEGTSSACVWEKHKQPSKKYRSIFMIPKWVSAGGFWGKVLLPRATAFGPEDMRLFGALGFQLLPCCSVLVEEPLDFCQPCKSWLACYRAITPIWGQRELITPILEHLSPCTQCCSSLLFSMIWACCENHCNSSITCAIMG